MFAGKFSGLLNEGVDISLSHYIPQWWPEAKGEANLVSHTGRLGQTKTAVEDNFKQLKWQ